MKRFETILAILFVLVAAAPLLAKAEADPDGSVGTTARQTVPSGAPSSSRARNEKEETQPVAPVVPPVAPHRNAAARGDNSADHAREWCCASCRGFSNWRLRENHDGESAAFLIRTSEGRWRGLPFWVGVLHLPKGPARRRSFSATV